VVVCLVTTAFLASNWCPYEVGYAQSRGSRLLPVLTEPGVDHPLVKSAHYADLAEDHWVFFGRGQEVNQLATLLRSPAERAEAAVLLVVVGPSGCGKSSLVRAGLLPVMADKKILSGRPRQWRRGESPADWRGDHLAGDAGELR
jgi:hypothetical protein